MTAATATVAAISPVSSLVDLTARRSRVAAAADRASRAHRDARRSTGHPALFAVDVISRPAKVLTHPAHAARVGSLIAAHR